jgi:hypothetical protein
MARFYVPLDVNYQMDDKILSAGVLAECIYVRALAYSKRATTEGRIRRAHLRILGAGIRRAEEQVRLLVQVGLWEETDDGWYIVGWLNHNLSNDALTEEKARKRALSIAGNHKRHHVARGIKDDDCELCHPPVREPESLPQTSRTGSLNAPISLAREDEQKTNRTEDEQKRKEEKASSSSSDLQQPVDNPEDEEDGFILDAMTIVAQRVCDQRRPADPFAYAKTITFDRDRITDVIRIHHEHPAFTAAQVAGMHMGTVLAQTAAAAPLYEPPPPVEVDTCSACNKPCALIAANPRACPIHDEDMRPADCPAVLAPVTHLRPETA